MITEDQLNRAHAESLAAHSRENEGPCICDGCDSNPYECCMNEADCLNSMREAAAEERDDARRERDL